MSEDISPGDVISYMAMCSAEGVNLQRGMNFRLRDGCSVILMSLRRGAPYADRIEEDGRVLVYEGHDASKTVNGPDPKSIDQPDVTPKGSPTQNKHFANAVEKYKRTGEAEIVKVYEKLRDGIWVYNGLFKLIDCWKENSGSRRVYKFKLELAEGPDPQAVDSAVPGEDDRVISSSVKLEVWKRDKGRCTKCGSSTGLHFDHIIPYSKGGSSKDPKNIQILCGKHNLEKHDRIE
jgi:HNH endonuclease